MKWKRWEELHDELVQCCWFAKVGDAISGDKSRARSVVTWDEAIQWSTAEISWWCVNEASNVLSVHLSNNHRQEYRKWNDTIKAFTPKRDKMLDEIVSPKLPEAANRPTIIAWIRRQLTSAYLEVAYSAMADTHLVCDQVEWYFKGQFPCGWFVANEESFPNEAISIVF